MFLPHALNDTPLLKIHQSCTVPRRAGTHAVSMQLLCSCMRSCAKVSHFLPEHQGMLLVAIVQLQLPETDSHRPETPFIAKHSCYNSITQFQSRMPLRTRLIWLGGSSCSSKPTFEAWMLFLLRCHCHDICSRCLAGCMAMSTSSRSQDRACV